MTTPQEFIDKWKQSGGAELANSQSFLNELCDLLEVPHPDPTKAAEDENVYVFEKHMKFDNGDGTTATSWLFNRPAFPHAANKEGPHPGAGEVPQHQMPRRHP